MEEAIFDVSRTDWTYKGLFFAEMDNKAMPDPFPPTEEFTAGLMAMIWIDENEIWSIKSRIKFHSGNKLLFSKELGKDCSIEKALGFLRQLPMVNECWYPNESGSIEEQFKLLVESDMVESFIMKEKVGK